MTWSERIPTVPSIEAPPTSDVVSNSTFKIKWSIGTSTIEGFGMRMNNSLAATYEINGEAGLVIYRLDGNGFDGLWAIRGHNGSGTEHLTPH
jgi:hypothetical protein